MQATKYWFRDDVLQKILPQSASQLAARGYEKIFCQTAASQNSKSDGGASESRLCGKISQPFVFDGRRTQAGLFHLHPRQLKFQFNHILNLEVWFQLDTVGIQSLEIGKKVLDSFDNVFHVYLMNGLQKYQKKNFFTVAF